MHKERVYVIILKYTPWILTSLVLKKLHFLNIVNEVLPLGQVEWKTVTSRNNEVCEQFPRVVDTIKLQFTNLCREIPPTGDPNMPREVQSHFKT